MRKRVKRNTSRMALKLHSTRKTPRKKKKLLRPRRRLASPRLPRMMTTRKKRSLRLTTMTRKSLKTKTTVTKMRTVKLPAPRRPEKSSQPRATSLFLSLMMMMKMTSRSCPRCMRRYSNDKFEICLPARK